MSKYTEIEGDLISLGLQAKFDIICHGCNCKSIMGAGIAPLMARAFGCDKFEMEIWGDDIQKLGNIDFQTFVLGKNTIWSLVNADNKLNEPELTVINAYTQYSLGSNHKNGVKIPLDYEALTLCMRKINHIFAGKHIGLPLIGCGLGGGDWNIVNKIIKKELKDMDVTIVKFKPK